MGKQWVFQLNHSAVVTGFSDVLNATKLSRKNASLRWIKRGILNIFNAPNARSPSTYAVNLKSHRVNHTTMSVSAKWLKQANSSNKTWAKYFSSIIDSFNQQFRCALYDIVKKKQKKKTVIVLLYVPNEISTRSKSVNASGSSRESCFRHRYFGTLMSKRGTNFTLT